MAAVEMMATIDAQQRLKLDGVLPVAGPVRVRILVLYPDTGSDTQGEWSEDAWLRAATPAKAGYSNQCHSERNVAPRSACEESTTYDIRNLVPVLRDAS